MWEPFRIFRPNDEVDDEHNRAIREVLAESIRILRASPSADTFLGRKTQEPFPQLKEKDKLV
ncbi:MAG: hypothetical protein JO141_34350 [Bradyrhizobium sp.]|nr:hypothetical protein [Bradyrhizobium sp.]